MVRCFFTSFNIFTMKTSNLFVIVILAITLSLLSCSRVGIDAIKPFKFAYLSDVHIAAGLSSVADLEASIADINSQDSLDFVILAGDITEFGSDEEFTIARETLSKLKIPYYIIGGNHDSKWSESGCTSFAKIFGSDRFYFVHNGVYFVGTNSGPNMRMMPGYVPRETFEWLDSLVATIPPEAPLVFVNHYPLDEGLINYREILSLLSKTNIQLAMCGHGHVNRGYQYGEIRGAMGRSNLRGGKEAGGVAGYNIVSVTRDSLFIQERFANGQSGNSWYKIALLNKEKNSAGSEPPMSVTSANEQPNNGPLPVAIWEYKDNSDIASAPAYALGNVYISNTAGQIKALNGQDGKLLWSYSTAASCYSSPAVDQAAGVVVVGSADCSVYGLDAASGELRWRVEAGRSVLGSPAIYNGVAYIGSSDGVFRAIKSATGELLWSFDGVRGFVESRPWVDGEGVYFGDWANYVYALEPTTGKLLWEWTNNKGRGLSAAAVWPLKANGRLFVVTPERRVHAIDASSGRELWSHRGGRESLGLSEDGSLLYVKTMQDTLLAFNTRESRKSASVTPLWSSAVGYGYEIGPSPITSAFGFTFIPTDKGQLFAVNATTGEFLWQLGFSNALINYVRPLEGGKILLSSMDGKVALMQLE